MWVAKIKFNEEGTLIGSCAQKYKVNLFGFPLSYYYEKNNVVVHVGGTLFGETGDKNKLIREMKKEKRVLEFEANGDFVVGTIREPICSRCIYNKDIIHLAPALISSEGYEVVTIGSFEREKLMKVFDYLENKRGGELVSIQHKKVKSISVMKVAPELTGKQKAAMELAIKNNYYKTPRETSVKKLAKLAGLSFSTFQVHLRKAEEKLIPYSFE